MRFWVTVGLLLGLLIGLPLAVHASDVESALYRANVNVSENGTTATTGAVVTFTANLTDYQDGTRTDSSMQYSGSDIAFMPAVNSTNLWVTWVDSISLSQTLGYILYLDGATGGKIRYFPDTAGMSIPDNATLELSANGTIEFKGYIDTDAGSSKSLVKKPGAVDLFVSDTVSGNITGIIYGSTSWVSPTTFNDPSSQWGNEANTYDENTATDATDTVAAGQWSAYLEWPVSAVSLDSVRVYVDSNATPISVDFYTGGAWVNIYEGAGNQGSWYTVTNGSTYLVTNVRMKVTNGNGGSYAIPIGEIDYGVVTTTWVTATGVATGERTVTLGMTTANATLAIDGTTIDSIALGGNSMLNNTNAWAAASSNATVYMESLEITKGGTQAGYWDWDYGSTFADQSANTNTATPTFRATDSDGNVTANMTSVSPTTEAEVTTFTLGELSDLFGSVPGAIPEMFSELDFTYVPAAAGINAILDTSVVPQALWWYPFIFGLICILGLLTYSATSMRVNQGRITDDGAQGNIMIMCVIIGVLLAVAGIMNPIPFWPALLFWIPGSAIILSEMHRSMG